MSKTFTFRVIIEPDDPSGYHGFVPSLPGVHTCGKTIEEVQKNLQDAVNCHLHGLMKDGEKIPDESQTIEIVKSFPIDVSQFNTANYA